MLPNSYSNNKIPLKASQRRQQQRLLLKNQVKLESIILLLIIVATWLLDALIFKSNESITKGVAIGAVLNWFAQAVFAWFVFRYTGAKAKRAVVNQLYLGQLIKWVIKIVGFSIIFLTIQSISVGAVIAGFILMQVGHFCSLWFIK